MVMRGARKSAVHKASRRRDERRSEPTADQLIHDWNWQPVRCENPRSSTKRSEMVFNHLLSVTHQLAKSSSCFIAWSNWASMQPIWEYRALGRNSTTTSADSVKEIADQNLPIGASCAARTCIEDIVPIIEISEKAGIPIEVAMFVGSSPIRQYVDGRDFAEIQRLTERAVTFASEHGMPVQFVTEDSTRSAPEVLAVSLRSCDSQRRDACLHCRHRRALYARRSYPVG